MLRRVEHEVSFITSGPECADVLIYNVLWVYMSEGTFK